MLTEQEVTRSWRQLFHGGRNVTLESVARGESLLEQLRAESPLRHRLGTELEELRRICLKSEAAAAAPVRRSRRKASSVG